MITIFNMCILYVIHFVAELGLIAVSIVLGKTNNISNTRTQRSKVSGHKSYI